MMEVQKIEKMVNDAIENNRIEVYYQPIYSTEKHIFTSAEALVRIRDVRLFLKMSVLLLRQVMCFNMDWNILKSTYP